MDSSLAFFGEGHPIVSPMAKHSFFVSGWSKLACMSGFCLLGHFAYSLVDSTSSG